MNLYNAAFLHSQYYSVCNTFLIRLVVLTVFVYRVCFRQLIEARVLSCTINLSFRNEHETQKANRRL